MRLGTRVKKVKRNSDGKKWDVEIENGNGGVDKEIVAAGLNSKPKLAKNSVG